MNNNTLQAYKEAQAAGDYLASDEIDLLELEGEEVIQPATTGRLIRSRYVGAFATDQWNSANGWTVTSAFTTNSNVGVYYGVCVTADCTEKSVAWRRVGSATSSVGDRIVNELGRIKDGWAGAGSIAPTTQAVNDVESVMGRLPIASKMPAIEIDEEDGMISLRWLANDRNSSFSLVFRGNGRVTTVIATIDPPRSAPLSFAVTEEIKIASKFDEPAVDQLIVG